VELILATYKLTDTGGASTYALTVTEHLARLGHSVTLYARELGVMADLARERALAVTARPEDLPARADGVLTGVHPGMALELAARYPDATRLFVAHSTEDFHLPPPVPGVVAATVVLNDIHAARASACTAAGEIVRLRQPVDLRRFCPRGDPRERPERILLLGNYHSATGGRGAMLREAWGEADLNWWEVGGDKQTLDVPAAIAQADVVVGYGRSVLEAMACGRPAYVHDTAGSEGWITPDSYARMEAGGFAVAAVRPPPDMSRLRDDLAAYRPEWGQAGRDIARTHHDARDHAAALVALLQRLGPGESCAEPSAVRALAQLAESQLRAELLADHYRVESNQWFMLYHGAQEELARERGAWDAERTELESRRGRLESQHLQAAQAAAETADRLHAFQRTRRYRLAQALAAPLDRLRGAVRTRLGNARRLRRAP
jgi:hypothetical protein